MLCISCALTLPLRVSFGHFLEQNLKAVHRHAGIESAAVWSPNSIGVLAADVAEPAKAAAAEAAQAAGTPQAGFVHLMEARVIHRHNQSMSDD